MASARRGCCCCCCCCVHLAGWSDSTLTDAQVAEGCTDEVLATEAVAMVRKHAANPENLIAGAFQRALVHTCRLLSGGAGTLRTYAETCGAEPDANQRVARALVRVRALLCGESAVASAAAAEWSCWQPRATSFWNCAQQPDWAGSPQACQLLDKMSECYEREAAAWCGDASGRAVRKLVLRALAPLPVSQCPDLERAARASSPRSPWTVVVVLGTVLLANLLLVVVVICCCTWCRRRRQRRLAKRLEEEELL